MYNKFEDKINDSPVRQQGTGVWSSLLDSVEVKWDDLEVSVKHV